MSCRAAESRSRASELLILRAGNGIRRHEPQWSTLTNAEKANGGIAEASDGIVLCSGRAADSLF
jgi:hypothetical protein